MEVKAKTIVLDLVSRLPDDISLHEIAREIEFIAGVREGLAELDRGEGVPIEVVEQQMDTWITK